MYKTVLNEATAEIIEKNSRFIASVKPVTTKEEAEAFIEEIRAKNRTANHNVYAYVLRENNYQKHSDDGEPGGTAGMPVLNVLLKQELTDAVIVVTRYFGGVLLGTGGLVRAYSASAALGVSNAQAVSMCEHTVFKIKCSYDKYSLVMSAMSSAGAISENAEFTDIVEVTGYILSENFESFEKNLVNQSNGTVFAEKEFEKFLPIK